MKVVFLSTYPPAPCGIGDYTRELRRAVEGIAGAPSVEVVAEQHESVQAELDSAVVRTWRRGSAWNEPALEAVLRIKPDLVHLQHEEAIMGQDGRLIRFLDGLGKAGIARVVTLHSVYAGRLGLPFWWPPPLFHRAIANRSEAIVVHQRQGGRDFLERQGVPAALIHVVPHGTPRMETPPRGVARDQLGIPPDAKAALFLGVIQPKKNIATIVAAAERLAPRVPGFRLLVAGRSRDRRPLDRYYTSRLVRRMQPGIRGGWLDLRRGFIPAEQMPSYFSAADVVLFPYDQSYGSASGVFHLALAAGRATICSSSPKFGEAREIFAERIPAGFAGTRDVGAWAASMEIMLTDPNMRLEAEALARKGAAETAWPIQGARYVEMYRAILGSGSARRSAH